MRNLEILWFEDVSALNEPVLSFPIIGRISMRQFFILGLASMISYLIFSSSHSIFAVIPEGIGAFLALTKPKVTSSEQMVISMVLFFMGRHYDTGNKKKKAKSKKLSSSSKKLGLADSLIEDSQENEIRTITVSDLSRPYRFKVKLVGPTGKVLANKKSKVYLDGTYLDALTTDINGELETIVIPKTQGKKNITVCVDEQVEPVFLETIEVKMHQENLA
ncbi:hypothetical protein [Candidatus Nitrosotalea okcheonensis]|uniref:Uncharacterized protein n=1 Tax=Candidatus Nitrosotalea okcheonensis TaxID=1903276 RepID=A0A2H1FIP4_9ARCH|nr:hypothetical protein [Candidatus Nitrosotalea okcheonensis]SMH72635.1 conserved protein of unknown function [Candidatus Nitrosotalea okcheonensis]